jgi:GntR family transcriptional regulator
MRSTTDPKRLARPRKASGRDRLADNGSGELLYLRVINTLKDEIVSGVYPSGSQLPTEEELCKRFSVSRYTVREALRRLREDRLVASRQGAGTTVIPINAADPYVHEVTSITDLVTFAVGTRFEVQSTTTIAADSKLAARIGCSPGNRWLAVCGLRYADKSEVPACWSEVFIAAQFAAVGRLLPRNRGPIFHLIEDLFGERIGEVHQEIAASTVPAGLARGLKVRAGAMALQVQRTYRLP